MRDVRQLRLPWPDVEFSTAGVPFPVEAIPPPLSYPGLLAPSGSGSLDPGDLGRGRTGILPDILHRGHAARTMRIREDGALPPLQAARAAASWRTRTAAGDHAPR